MAILSGNVGWGDTLAAAKVYNVSPTMAIIDPVDTPFATFLLNSPGKKRPITNTKFQILTDLYNPQFWTTNLSTTGITTVTTLTVDSNAGLRVGDILGIITPGNAFPQTELLRVDAVNSTTSIDVTRSFRFYTGSTRVAIPDEAILFDAGQLVGDKATLANMVSTISKMQDQVEIVNYAELFVDVTPISDIEARTEHYVEKNPRDWKNRLMLSNLKRRIEKALMFGVPGTEAAPSAVPGTDFTTGGYYYWMRRVVGDNAIYGYPGAPAAYKQDTDLSQADFRRFLSDGFLHGAEEKLLFVSPLCAEAIDSWNLTAVRVEAGSEFFGVRTKVYASSHGVVRIIPHRLLRNPPLSGLASTNQVGLGGMMLLVDPTDVQLVYLQGRDFMMETNVGVAGDEVKSDKASGVVGLLMHNPAKHGVFEGVKTYSA